MGENHEASRALEVNQVYTFLAKELLGPDLHEKAKDASKTIASREDERR